APSWGLVLLRRAAGLLLVAGVSLFVLVSGVLFQEVALANAAFLVMVALAAWRPRYGIYAALLLSVPLEPRTDDQFMHFGWYMQTPISATSDWKMFIFSPIELILLMSLLSATLTAIVERRALRGAQLHGPLLAFLFLL